MFRAWSKKPSSCSSCTASKHAALRLLLGTNVPPVRANPAMLRQILINLASAEKKLEIKTQKELDLDAKVLRSSSLKHAVCAEQSLVNYRVAPFARVPSVTALTQPNRGQKKTLIAVK
jgi:hypothetical protein